ncbi:unnamed protein product [Amoebophrya sp. A25]|nr:unnamed protein product [Amoebophrya sp. A25]|eukprot:GSA25T00026257001.1
MFGRSLTKSSDFSIGEQRSLFGHARRIKEVVKTESGGYSADDAASSANGGASVASLLGFGDKGHCATDTFRMSGGKNGNNGCVYLVFIENSTRTKESFRNAAAFHGCKVCDFDCATSSLSKGETLTDTIKMLVGYSERQTSFIIRSKWEGVCTWLDWAIGEKFCRVHDIPRPSFINAGDGQHEHPSQELLDDFTFLEHQDWKFDSIHVALIGDLWHGRTVHSKADGLRIFGDVKVDLIAPDELQMPDEYVKKMQDNGFTVEKYKSIDAYLASKKCATIWYFTRLQLERMSDEVQKKSADLRKAVTFSLEKHQSELPEGAKFYHPLPRDSRNPVIPFEVDSTPLNGWDTQSRNGYFVRTALLGMVGGHLAVDVEEEMEDVDDAEVEGCANGGEQAESAGNGGVATNNKREQMLSILRQGPPVTATGKCKHPACVSHVDNGQREVLQWIVDGKCVYCDHPIQFSKTC